MSRLSANELAAPPGMTGLAVEPWTRGEIYAVAADWSQAGSPVMVYGEDSWSYDSHGSQVANFRHSARMALEHHIIEAIEAGGEEPGDDEVANILSNAVEIRTHEIGEMVRVLDGFGERFTGNSADESAQDWIDNGFTADNAGEWCAIGVWDASTAGTFRDTGKTPEQITQAAQQLIEEAGDDVATEYTDSCPIYSVCNYDTRTSVLIDACE